MLCGGVMAAHLFCAGRPDAGGDQGDGGIKCRGRREKEGRGRRESGKRKG